LAATFFEAFYLRISQKKTMQGSIFRCYNKSCGQSHVSP